MSDSPGGPEGSDPGTTGVPAPPVPALPEKSAEEGCGSNKDENGCSTTATTAKGESLTSSAAAEGGGSVDDKQGVAVAASAAAAAMTSSTTTTAAAAAAAAEESSENKEDKKDEDDESDDDEEEILEESPCGRWNKRREEVKYRDVPGVDAAYLAMDTEEGVEVVWNEASFSETKKFKAQEDKLKKVFEALTLIGHPNIVKFHRFWMDSGINQQQDSKSEKTTTTNSAETSENNEVASNEDSLPPSKEETLNSEGEKTVNNGDNESSNPSKNGTEGSLSGEKEKDSEKSSSIEKKKPNRLPQKPRLIFITEYVSSGSLKQFLRRTKKNARKTQLSSWKRWCVQILSALRYLHLNSNPPIVHGNLTCDTIFIQHNGLVKIGSVAPDIIHQNVKTCRDNIKNLHYLAPEYGDSDHVRPTTAMDIYAFGMAALEMAALEIQSSTTSSSANNEDGTSTTTTTHVGVITDEAVQKTIESVEDERQRDFIRKCLAKNPDDRPTAHQLLFHPVLFEVHSCKLLAAHRIVNLPEFDTTNINETINDKAIQAHYGADSVIAFIRKKDGKVIEYRLKDFPATEKLEKFTEDVKNGIYPITAFGQKLEMGDTPNPRRPSSAEGSSEQTEVDTRNNKTDPAVEPELRRLSSIHASLYFMNVEKKFLMSLLIKLEDAMNRQLYTHVSVPFEPPDLLSNELIYHGFINEADFSLMHKAMTEVQQGIYIELSMDAKENGDKLTHEEYVAKANFLARGYRGGRLRYPKFEKAIAQNRTDKVKKPPKLLEVHVTSSASEDEGGSSSSSSSSSSKNSKGAARAAAAGSSSS